MKAKGAFFNLIKSILLTIVVANCGLLLAQAPQLRTWSLPPNKVDFVPPPPTASPLEDGIGVLAYQAGQQADANHNLMHDKNGNLLFFIVDGNIYDARGEFIDGVDFLGLPSGFPIGGPEYLIVPVPGSDMEYYLITKTVDPNFVNQNSCGNEADLFVARLDMCVPSLNNGLGFVVSTQIINVTSTEPGENTLHLAASKEQPGNVRFLWVGGAEKIHKFIIDGVGVTEDVGKEFDYTDLPAGMNAASGNSCLRSEMELIEVTSVPGVKFRLAAPYLNSFFATGQLEYKIGVYDLDDQGNLVTLRNFSLGLVFFAQHEHPKGLEFSPDGNILYVSNTGTTPIQYIDIGANTVTPFLNLPDFARGHIELGNDGVMYFAGPNSLGGLNNPNTPAVVNFNAGAIGTGIDLSHVFGDFNTIDQDVRILPDQIDGENYDETYDDLDCCVFHGSYDAEDPFIAQVSATWDVNSNPFNSPGPIFIKEKLTIPKGIDIKIEGLTFKFGPEAIVIVEEGDLTLKGGKLTLNNTTFTHDDRCGIPFMWNGIQVLGDPTIHQFFVPSLGGRVQGQLTVKNNSLIEHAFWAANAGDQSFTKGGGIIKASDSRFHNNVGAVLMEPYEHINPNNNKPFKNISEFTRNTFETVGLLNIPTLFPGNFVLLADVDMVQFFGNTFQRTPTSGFGLNERGNGIFSFESTYHLLKSGNQSNTFSGLRFGIRSTSSGSFNFGTVRIEDCDFTDNQHGAWLLGYDQGLVTITNNNLDVGTEVTIFPFPSFVPPSTGLYLYGCSGYTVEENDFTTPFPNDKMYGAVVRNSGPACNFIYRNTFSNLFIGCQALEVNDGLASFDGLEILCNQLNSDKFHITVIDGFISEHQGLCDLANTKSPAGNTFTHNCPTIVSDYFYDHGPSQDILYSHHPDLITTPVCFTNNATAPNGFGTEVLLAGCSPPFVSGDGPTSSCPKSPTGGGPIGDEIGLLQGEIDALLALIDGGDKDALLQSISIDAPGVAKNNLIAASPYLSDSVLLAYIATDPPAGHLQQVITANSPLTQQVLDALNALDIPAGIQNLINEVQVGTSAREELETLVAFLESRRVGLVNKLIQVLLNDTTINGIDSVIDLLEDEDLTRFRCMLVAAYIKNGDLTSAQQLLDELNTDPALGLFCELQQLHLNAEITGIPLLTSVQSNPVIRQQVETIAEDTLKLAGIQARGLLEIALQLPGMVAFNKPFEFPVRLEEPVILNNKKGQDDESEDEESRLDKAREKMGDPQSEDWQLGNYPNPFTEGTIISAWIPGEWDEASVVIRDLMGKAIKIYQLNNGENAIQVSSVELGYGVYFYSLTNNDQTIATKKMIHIK